MVIRDDLAFLDATAQAELVRNKEIQPIELVEAAIERIERLNPTLNAVITPMYDLARGQATGKLPEGPFRGVPFLLKDMDKAVDRLHKALLTGENILIYGDYDVDGVSSASLLYLVLSRMVGSKISYYIPDRMTEGYGLSSNSIQEAADNDVNLIVTVDCGVTAVEEVRLANQLGMDTIVCDHHQPAEELPEAG